MPWDKIINVKKPVTSQKYGKPRDLATTLTGENKGKKVEYTVDEVLTVQTISAYLGQNKSEFSDKLLLDIQKPQNNSYTLSNNQWTISTGENPSDQIITAYNSETKKTTYFYINDERTVSEITPSQAELIQNDGNFVASNERGGIISTFGKAAVHSQEFIEVNNILEDSDLLATPKTVKSEAKLYSQGQNNAYKKEQKTQAVEQLEATQTEVKKMGIKPLFDLNSAYMNIKWANN